MTPSAILPASIPDSQLGLDASEIRILRQHQQIVLSGVGGSASGGAWAVFFLVRRGGGGLFHPSSSPNTVKSLLSFSSILHTLVHGVLTFPPVSFDE